jgi:hypothetical protein
MRFTRIVYTVAAVYGVVVLLPLYFLLNRIGREAPPAVTHPEFFYGFIGLALLWQFVFLLIARDPVRYGPVIPLTILEKLAYAVPGFLLYSQGKLHPRMLFGPAIDALLCILFVAAYFAMQRAKAPARG